MRFGSRRITIGSTILISVLALPGTLPAEEAEEIVISVVTGRLAPEAAAALRVVSVDGDGGVVRELSAPGATSVRVAVEGLEYVSCRSRLIWCPRVGVGASAASVVNGQGGGTRRHKTPGTAKAPPVRVVHLTAYPLVDLALPLVLPSGESLASGTPTVEGWLETASGTFHFLEPGALDGNLLRWRGPAGRTDYRIAVEGWAPRYLFDRDVEAGAKELEPLRLVRGSSVSLHAVEESSGLPVAGAAVRAEPYPPLAEDGNGPVAARAVTSENGFAQIVGLDGEYYSLIVESEGRPPTRIDGVRLQPDAETRLAEVLLSEFAEVQVFISPQTAGILGCREQSEAGPAAQVAGEAAQSLGSGQSPGSGVGAGAEDGACERSGGSGTSPGVRFEDVASGGRWRIALQRLDQAAEPLIAEADSNGAATLHGLPTGSYLLDLLTPDGDVLHSQQMQVTGDQAAAIDLDFVTVRGQVRLDGNGVQARVALSRGAGDRLPFVTNEDGEFGGHMPRPTGDVVAAAVDTAGGLRRMFMVNARVHDEVLSLRFDLGDRTVRGVVLDGSTLEPLPGAAVSIERADEEDRNDKDDLEAFVSFPLESDQEGRFAFDGLDEGRYRLEAWLDGFTDGKAEVSSSPFEDWVADDVRTVRLLLQPGDPLDLLLTRTGSPLPAATVEVVAQSRSGGVGAGFGETDRSGRTRILVPRGGVGPAAVVVKAPPHLLWSGCVSLGSPDEPLVRLDLMDEPVGTVVLRNTAGDTAGNTAGDFSEPVLVTPHGGVLSLNDLIDWSSLAGGAGADLAFGRAIDRIELPGLSAGRYRILQSAAFDYGTYVNACAGALDASASAGSVLVPGGRVEFEVDLGFGADDEPALSFPADL